MKTPKSPVEISAKAEARLEVSTEIPAESSGRLVDALTDLIRPWSESRGLKADRIRLQREEVLLQIARHTRDRIALEAADIHAIPNKTFVPFLEKASLESDDEIIDLWQNLLFSNATIRESQRPIFVDILSKMSPTTAKALKFISESVEIVQSEAGDLSPALSLHKLNNELARAIAKEVFPHDLAVSNKNKDDIIGKVLQESQKFLERYENSGAFLTSINCSHRGFSGSVGFKLNSKIDNRSEQIKEELTYLGVMHPFFEEYPFNATIDGGNMTKIIISGVSFTSLGRDLFRYAVYSGKTS